MRVNPLVGLKKRIFLVEDHTILREGLKSILSSNPDYDIIGEAGDGSEAIRNVARNKPDLIIMDLSMPLMNGLESIQEIRKLSPQTRILVLTIHDTEEYILPALKAGANGYLLKYATQDELLTAIRSVLDGKAYLSPGISDKVIAGYVEGDASLKAKLSWDTLSQREREILKLIAEGYKNKAIADYLCISVKTVAKHRANIMEKLDIHNVAALTVYAMEKKLIEKM